jgi:transposase, IS5 family
LKPTEALGGKKKNGQKFYGYKDPIAIDNAYKLIRSYEVTSSEVHDSQVFYELLSENSSSNVWADCAYRSEENEIMLAADGYRSHMHKKAQRNAPPNTWEIEVV